MSFGPPGLPAYLLSLLPANPNKWNKAYLDGVVARSQKRESTIAERIEAISAGRVMPDTDQVAIGSGKHFQMAILYLDIVGFSSWPCKDWDEQKRIIQVFDLFMAEMMNIIRDHSGVVEKNTGDGILAYFGTDTSSSLDSIALAVECAVIMHYVNDTVITPRLVAHGLWPVRFRIGIDYGDVTIAKIGIPRGFTAFVAIGAAAIVACRVMDQIPDGGIAIGNNVYVSLPKGWQHTCKSLKPRVDFIYVEENQPYPVWQLNHRLSPPTS